MKSSHTAAATFAAADDSNLIAYGGLAAGLRLAERCGLSELVRGKARLAGAANGAGTAPDAKVMSLVAGMLAGADSIDDVDVLRHGAMSRAFGGIRASSTLGTFLRAFTWGHVRQLESAAHEFTGRLVRHCALLPGADQVVFLDIDSKVKPVHGYAKQGAAFGYTRQRGLHFQIVTASTPIAPPVIVASRLRKGSAGSGKGAAHLIAEAVNTVRAMGVTGQIVVRGDSAFCSHKTVAACRRLRVRFSFTIAQRKKIRTTIAAVDGTAWTAIKYTDALFDEDTQRWVSDAEIAETEYTAFTGKPQKYHVTAPLLVRRVKRLGQAHIPDGQGELFTAHRFHAVFTDTALGLVEAEATHRRHAIIEQVFADLEDSALAHLPSGKFTANAAWLTLAALAHNLTRALGTLASTFHARARTGTVRRHLIAIPARLAAGARTLTWHFPDRWPWLAALDNLCTAVGHRLRT
ncbi:IS1380 family transposase [Streptomyces somaliensis DSM 40738]|uniref:IS1380 family transposase n=1 Tax=Streptomyces somaliensis (strain ATCC 33201 / DSM 40738 / JCM 12659 / KCTC 9044 / NCTC 11332 / NRRL B-12077 / IP 733) TaxID=1134445 RepID=A0AA44IFI5_STRE0|nr:IS1380 family transposase [Streptomyces somaliensis]MCQ0022517.1 IS1380 family transposase [Streptomyces somaliensis DSM 40738]MCQ0022602.1 IS1380 family transposase [Streptomyces somaliensis DSM 40738]NKY16702.1 IS1380 family transposase [Streptomyces somaliensis DSM 40738]